VREVASSNLAVPTIYLVIRRAKSRREGGSFCVASLTVSHPEAAVTTIGMHFLAHWCWSIASIFGVLIAATDPVAVIAVFKDSKVHGRVRMLVEAESLFNDATAAVAFMSALAIISGSGISAGRAAFGAKSILFLRSTA
jgi:NhaP-type Na+/H+ or K+/H+ antiporter